MPASGLYSQPFSTIEGPKLYTYFPKWKRNRTPNAEHKFIVNVPYEVIKYREIGKFKVLACSLPRAGDYSNIILGVLMLNHTEQDRFKNNIIKQKIGQRRKILLLGDC